MDVDDGRPKGWTEALCLQYIADAMPDSPDLLAAFFVYGDWHEIHKRFPHFVKWMKQHAH